MRRKEILLCRIVSLLGPLAKSIKTCQYSGVRKGLERDVAIHLCLPLSIDLFVYVCACTCVRARVLCACARACCVVSVCVCVCAPARVFRSFPLHEENEQKPVSFHIMTGAHNYDWLLRLLLSPSSYLIIFLRNARCIARWYILHRIYFTWYILHLLHIRQPCFCWCFCFLLANCSCSFFFLKL